MKMKAAILWEPKTDWSVEEVELDPPKAGEVLVKLVGSGLCHSDEHLLTGDLALPEEAQKEMGIQQFPVIGGHEGAGEVVEVGAGCHQPASPATTSCSASSRRAGSARAARPATRTSATSAPTCSPGARSPTSPPATTPAARTSG